MEYIPTAIIKTGFVWGIWEIYFLGSIKNEPMKPNLKMFRVIPLPKCLINSLTFQVHVSAFIAHIMLYNQLG